MGSAFVSSKEEIFVLYKNGTPIRSFTTIGGAKSQMTNCIKWAKRYPGYHSGDYEIFKFVPEIDASGNKSPIYNKEMKEKEEKDREEKRAKLEAEKAERLRIKTEKAEALAKKKSEAATKKLARELAKASRTMAKTSKTMSKMGAWKIA